ncbi:hypothetical protein HYH03_002203 [Edaphochlamys debaryana]|uniref:DNA recombination and repair protein Rad51-like C-terminal domain-containing protein n=1 Tax=Edaphochlamys debaryana TaxID=47281 RepID=A0A836C493_9CHLO|nr:hypothetical protein HYH03_002203 [Edaphochlamys debaryana]|eukprot:KAG2499916.1 hypothetical protein HYH03_002203 [Edaphochlamys debaryana]
MAPADLNPLHGLLSGMEVEPGVGAALERLPDVTSVDTMLCGATASGRSSLALHFALHHAATANRPVMFLCRQDGLEGSMPLLPRLCASDNPCLHLLQLKYVRSYLDIQRFAACMHLLQTPLAALVVEDLSSLLRIDDRNTLVRTLAMLLEGVRSYRAASGCECPLLVTDSTDESRRPRYIFDRWFPLTLAISAAAGPSGRAT